MLDVLAAGGAVPPFFILLTLVLSSVVVVSLVFSRMSQSLLVGYFLCGLILANSGALEWAGVADTGVIGALSEIGVVLLLFTLGIEFSLGELKSLKKPALLGGGVQVGLTIIVTLGIAMLLGLPFKHALMVGFAVSLSSTAVSLKTFQDMGLPDSPQGRTALGIAIFQDLAAIVFMVLLPALGGTDEESGGLLMALVKGGAFMLGIVVLSRHGFPQMLDAVARTRSRELFTVTVVGMCAAVALVSGLLGLSPALGAFAAGVVVSESIYSHRVLSDILPFKDLFLTVFFVSVGLLIDLDEVKDHWALIAAATVGILVLKGAIVAFAAKLSGLRMGSWLTTAAALASTGEFSIVLLNRASDFEILSSQWEQVLLASTAISMGLVPTLMKSSIGIVQKMRKHQTAEACRKDVEMGLGGQIEGVSDHIIICGYGPVGRNLHANLHRANVRVIVLEMNPLTVKELMQKGVKCLFADARDREALEVAHVERARGIAITFPDKEAAIAALHTAREMNPGIVVYARSKFAPEVEELERAGVDHVLYDEEQSGLALTRAVMRCYSADIEPDWEI
ncbi:putative cation/proton antiporter YbaL [Rubritalea halochordaticola]|uniref:Cation/proton antiporter YbaL n=1 Tax=Rubritalea halochordaticola TaxID=714537 RepID=A0ABP9V4F4_9BACT